MHCASNRKISSSARSGALASSTARSASQLVMTLALYMVSAEWGVPYGVIINVQAG